MNTNDPGPRSHDRDTRAQVEAERAERDGLAHGGDPRVDRYRLVVRALRQPLQSQLPADFTARVSAMARKRERSASFEDWLVVLLMVAMGAVALLFIVPALAKAVQAIASLRLPLLPWHATIVAIACVGVVWACESGWMRLHPPHR